MKTPRVRVITTPAQMHAAFDPDGFEVWCDWAELEAWTNDGFCRYCGSTEHAPIKRAKVES